MATVTEQMQHVLDGLDPVMNDPATAPYARLAALRLLHDALLPRLSPYGRSWYDTLVRETTLTLRSREDNDGRNGGEARG